MRHRVRITAVALPLFLWFSTRLFGGLRAALNEVFDTDERRPWPMAKLLDLSMVLGTGALLVLSSLLTAWEARNASSVTRSFALDWLWRFGLETTAFALGVVLFFMIFKLMPSRRIDWRTALVAAVFCSLGFEVAKRLYALYVTRFATRSAQPARSSPSTAHVTTPPTSRPSTNLHNLRQDLHQRFIFCA